MNLVRVALILFLSLLRLAPVGAAVGFDAREFEALRKQVQDEIDHAAPARKLTLRMALRDLMVSAARLRLRGDKEPQMGPAYRRIVNQLKGELEGDREGDRKQVKTRAQEDRRALHTRPAPDEESREESPAPAGGEMESGLYEAPEEESAWASAQPPPPPPPAEVRSPVPPDPARRGPKVQVNPYNALMVAWQRKGFVLRTPGASLPSIPGLAPRTSPPPRPAAGRGP